MNSKLTFLAILFSMLPLTVLVCVAPPAGLLVDHTELVLRTDTIVWARAVGEAGETAKIGRKPHELMLFETIEVLKGELSDRFTLSNGFVGADLKESGASLSVSGESDFDGHRAPGFWEEQLARQWNGADCKMYPTFSVGSRYLLFFGEEHWQGYEKVKSEDDLWLTPYVDFLNSCRSRRQWCKSTDHMLTNAGLVFLTSLKVDHTSGATPHINS